jgi:hypothetical protein
MAAVIVNDPQQKRGTDGLDEPLEDITSKGED